MLDLVACPVCTLYLHKGMSLAEHLETHPKEQVIKALVSLATGSLVPNEASPSKNTSKTSTPTATTTISSSPSLDSCQSSSTVLQSSSNLQPVFATNSNSTNPNTSSNNFTTSPTGSNSSQAPILSTSFGDTIPNRQPNLNSPAISNKKSSSFNTGSNNHQSTDHLGLVTNSNIGNQNGSTNYPSNLQHLFNAKTKQLPPPPAYGQAISQLRSQNSLNFARTNTTKSLANLSINNSSSSNNNVNSNGINYQISSNTSSPYTIVNQSSSNYYNNSNICQETLDFSLPKQHYQTASHSSILPAPPYIASSNIRRTQNTVFSSNQHGVEFTSQVSTHSNHFTSNSENLKLAEPSNIKKVVANSRTPSPICLITSIRSTEAALKEAVCKNSSLSSSVLRFADTPPTAQYIERDSGDFLVQESPRHVVECIEKDNGEFSVIEKVIKSPPSIVSVVNEHIIDENPLNNSMELHDEVETTPEIDEQTESICENESYVTNEDCCSERVEYTEIDIKKEKFDNSYQNENFIYPSTSKAFASNIEEMESKAMSSKRKLNSKGVKVLSNVKLDPNKSLEIVENIQKCSTEEFWTGIVNTIKNEECDKSYTSSSLPSTGASTNEPKVIEAKSTLNDKKCSYLNEKVSASNQDCETKIIATSVIRLAINQAQSGPKNISKKLKSNKDLDTSNDQESNIQFTHQNQVEPIPSTSSQSKTLYGSSSKKQVYKKHPKKLVVKFKNPPPPPPPLVPSPTQNNEIAVQEVIEITANDSCELSAVKPASLSSLYVSCSNKESKPKILDDTDENTLNNMMEQIVNEEESSLGEPHLDQINNFIGRNLSKNLNLKVEKEANFSGITSQPSATLEKDSSTLQMLSSSLSSLSSSTSMSSCSSSSSNASMASNAIDQQTQSLSKLKIIHKTEFENEKKNFPDIEAKERKVQHVSNIFEDKKDVDISLASSNVTKTVFIIEEIDDGRQCESKLASFEQNSQLIGNFNEYPTINCAFSTAESINESGSHCFANASSQLDKQPANRQENSNEMAAGTANNPNNLHQNTYCDYPFSFLYASSSAALPNSTNINFTNGSFTQGANNNQNNIVNGSEIILNSNSCSSSNLIDKNTNSVASTSTATSSSVSIYSKGINDDNATNIQIFSRYVAPNFFNPRENSELEEKNSYLDLDLCTRHIANNGGENLNAAGSSISNAIMNLNATTMTTHSTRDNMVTELNIRTDEKMPAKGEISEQESNGDIENSWSQPIYNELTYKYSNPYDVSHESWSLSHDAFFNPQDLSNVQSKLSNNLVLENDIKPNLPGTSSEYVPDSATNKKLKKRKKPPTLFSNTTTVLEAVSINNATVASSSAQNAQIDSAIISKKKAYQCDHCSVVFVRLKDRNHHMVSVHQYKRVNRRLIREAPSSTVTSATINHAASLELDTGNFINIGETKPDLNDAAQPILLPSQYIKTEHEFPEASQPIIEPVAARIDDITDGDDKKPVLAVVAAKTTISSHYPRTKYDSIRTNVYRLLMNFNLGVLKRTTSVEIDENIFNSKSFCCMVCKRDFISVKLFDEHLSEHPAECFTCGKKFSRWTYFSIHLKRHLGWKDFGCTICQKKFVIRSALIEHMRIHTGLTPLNCNLCSKSFKRYSNLTQHKRVCHSKKSIRKNDYVCHCGEVLPTKARFIWHKETHDPKPKCCPWCCDRFIHANSLRRHIRLAHADKFAYNEPAECPICNNVYAKTSLKGHMATHSMDTQHECAICNKSFSTKWNLKIHSWVHANRTAKPFKCEHCTKAFVREIDYKNHLNAHKQIRPYTCEYCGCKFIRKYNYLRHRREHHGQKKFSCDLCGKQFHRHYYLTEHRRIHTGERPFLCTICGKSSTTKTNHNKHLKIHHSRDPFTSEA